MLDLGYPDDTAAFFIVKGSAEFFRLALEKKWLLHITSYSGFFLSPKSFMPIK
ncbi:hypothetical protein [Peribacillus aracenensis]|uniref:hypothetical protein n=1 Tax=Peribacillus aracenensis TaxID=2976708 RepID=UPI0021A60C35|nr:hypothetical protein [Peribacillus sp. BBB004]